MLLLHVTEACIWGVVLNKVGLISNLRDSIYFSANTYTTIGYGFMILPQSWRELSPIMAISGLFTFAWTTGEMFGIVGQQRELVADLAEIAQESKRLSRAPQSSTMKSRLTFRNVVFALLALVFLIAVPSSLRYAYQHGGFYLFSAAFLQDLPKRLTGPGRFRFVLQPAVAIFLGIRAGNADARAGRPPYIFSSRNGFAESLGAAEGSVCATYPP